MLDSEGFDLISLSVLAIYLHTYLSTYIPVYVLHIKPTVIQHLVCHFSSPELTIMQAAQYSEVDVDVNVCIDVYVGIQQRMYLQPNRPTAEGNVESWRLFLSLGGASCIAKLWLAPSSSDWFSRTQCLCGLQRLNFPIFGAGAGYDEMEDLRQFASALCLISQISWR
jgi:hypothetical protein